MDDVAVAILNIVSFYAKLVTYLGKHAFRDT